MDILAEAVCLYKSDGSPSVVTSLARACWEVLCGNTTFVWNKYSCCVFRHPCVLFGLRTIPTTLNFELATHTIPIEALGLLNFGGVLSTLKEGELKSGSVVIKLLRGFQCAYRRRAYIRKCAYTTTEGFWVRLQTESLDPGVCLYNF